MSCCSSKGCDEFFSERVARRDARRYRRRGPDGTTRKVVELIRPRVIAKQTLLEIGGGIGAIQLELLRDGAAVATNVELSPAYEPYAAELLSENGLSERVTRVVLDFAAQSAEVEAADVVVLNRVVCCYPDYQGLVAAAADHTRRQLVLTFPRDAWWMRTGIGFVNLLQRVRRKTFRVHLHPPDAIVGAVTSRGLEQTDRTRDMIWELAAFQRSADGCLSCPC
jgi:2-polyprenyl-3-methyl-5-hydroxy-6-metoxy-1,4-benzoquinol methylase